MNRVQKSMSQSWVFMVELATDKELESKVKMFNQNTCSHAYILNKVLRPYVKVMMHHLVRSCCFAKCEFPLFFHHQPGEFKHFLPMVMTCHLAKSTFVARTSFLVSLLR